MNTVIPILVDTSSSPIDFIDEAYNRLAALPNFRVREGQKDLSREICKAIVANTPLAAEAPTGTGKTLAYLIGALAAQQQLSVIKEIPIVVATATKGLQAQILSGDTPRLVEAGIIDKAAVIIAKGRRNYLCVSQAERFMSSATTTGQYDLLDESQNHLVEATEEIREAMEHFYGKAWNGDFDNYQGTVGAGHDSVRASVDTCVGRKCEQYEVCPFFSARSRMSYSKIIVANHDLVLSDLMMQKADQDPLFPGNKYIVVFDEAHNLPDKALDAGSAHIDLAPYKEHLEKLPIFSTNLFKVRDIARLMSKAHILEADFHPGQLIVALDQVIKEIKALAVDPESMQARFPQGEIPPALDTAIRFALYRAQVIQTAMTSATSELKSTNIGERNVLVKTAITDLLYMASFYASQIKQLVRALDLFLDTTERAIRWITNDGTITELNSSPIEGADVLRKLLWNNSRVIPVLMSATLKDFEGFDRFRARAGMPDETLTMTLPHIFPYHESELIVVDMEYAPRFEFKAEYLAELQNIIHLSIDDSEGTLVLCPSAALMEDIVPILRKKFPGKVLCQREAGIEALVKEHKHRISSGTGSILCGLATMAEGLDLPGEFCTHVIICALPFVAPTSPVEQELAEILGPRYFKERALPDALIKLIQMVGRLMRRESDRGRITIYDKRILWTVWGRKMLEALPRFAIKVTKPMHTY